MHRRMAALAIALSVLGASHSRADDAARPWPGIFERSRPALVYLKADRKDRRTGEPHKPVVASGFVVSANGYILTARDVVTTEGNVATESISGALASSFAPASPVELVAENADSNLALLKFKNTALKLQYMTLGDPQSVKVGEELGSMGFPGGQEYTAKTGDFNGPGGARGTWITSININEGDTGAPVLDYTGRVVAIVVWRVPGLDSVNYVVPVTHAANLLQITSARIEARPPDLAKRGIDGERMRPEPDEVRLAQEIIAAVDRGAYRKAADSFPTLKASIHSGIGYSAYPALALAFDQLSREADALGVLDLLDGRLRQDSALGVGFLAPGQRARSWLLETLEKVIARLDSPAVSARAGEIVADKPPLAVSP